MKVKVNINNTSSISMSEAVTMPSLMMMTSIISDKSLVRGTHTHTQIYMYTKTLGSILKFAKPLTIS